MPYSQRVEKVNSQKIMHKKFSPAFFKRRWGQVGKALVVLRRGRNFLKKSAGGA